MPLHLVPSFSSFDDVSETRSKFDRASLVDDLLETASGCVVSDPLEARRLALDLLPILDGVEDDMKWAERSMTVGEILLSVDEVRWARERFEQASVIFDAHDDVWLLARCLFGLGRASTMLHDPIGRTFFEDAKSLLEEIGDEAGVFAVDVELRHLGVEDDEQPQSAHAIAAPDSRR